MTRSVQETCDRDSTMRIDLPAGILEKHNTKV